MLPPGFEPGLTVPKTVVISVSLRERFLDSALFFFNVVVEGIPKTKPEDEEENGREDVVQHFVVHTSGALFPPMKQEQSDQSGCDVYNEYFGF